MTLDVESFIDEKGGASSGLKDLALLKNLWPYIRPYQHRLLLCLVLLVPATLTQVALPMLVQRAIDGPVTGGDMSGLIAMCALYFGVMAVHYGLEYNIMVISQTTGQQIIYEIRTALYEHLQTLSPRFYHQTPVGKLVTRVTNDVENLSEMFSSGGMTILMDLACIIGVVIFMFVLHWQLALLTCVMITIICGVLEFLRRRSRAGHDRIRVHVAAMNAYFQENFSGMEIVQLYRREEKNYSNFLALNNSNLKTSLSTVFYDCSMAAWTEFLTLLTLIVILGVGGWSIVSGVMTFGLLIAFFLYVQMIFEPIEDLADKYTIIQSGLASIDKIMALFQETPELALDSPKQPAGSSLTKPEGRVVFENVSFGYLPNQRVIEDISLTIEAGDTIAIIGPTGSGKTTLIKLLTRFYDLDAGQGSIRIDGAAIQELPLSHLRQHIVVIQQDDFLFSRSVAENITLDYQIHEKMARNPVLSDHLHTIIEQVNARHIIEKLPDGLSEVLRERGRNLSSGEKQLLLFARAVYHDPAILVLDEATSAIDPHTEHLVQQAMERVMKGRTTILIAHRLSTIQRANRILVISKGQLVENGSHKELVERDGLYARFFNYHQTLESVR